MEENEVKISNERIERYLELKKMEKTVSEELDLIKKEIFAENKSEFEVGDHVVKVSDRTRMDLNKDNVAKLIEDAVKQGLIQKENVETDYIKTTTYQVITIK